ncbi:hypothetical protein SAMN05421788_1037 [Filimonas lacunae]|uniref:Peptidase S74 domain-containing protein n=1 Tax=Filimonas lacunae TaxID=477680 RepID=A0A173MJL3_9BACT|nr:hypothetical protein [Filimonas lacunae]BAV07656.1 hypothetical protein FLA_3687 [Filimonas lacunae]SIT03091.1 hypothetical protein SAMN05421788_1037 [Filimonas lacunae]
MLNKLTVLCGFVLVFLNYSYAQTDTTSRNAGLPNYGRTIILADSVARARIGDSAVVTLNTVQTITAAKNFAPAITGNGAAVTITPSFTATANSNQLYGLDIADPTVINTGGYTNISSMSARFRGSVLVGGTIDAKYFRTNELMRSNNDNTLGISKSSANLLNGLVFKSVSAVTATSNIQNSTLFTDTVYFNSNTPSATGYSQVRLTPALTQTGYSGITRGLYVSPILKDVTDFRAIETNVPFGNGYQLYLGGGARNYMSGRTTVDSIWNFNDLVYYQATASYLQVRTNGFTYKDLASVNFLKAANPTTLTGTRDLLRYYVIGKSNITNANWNGIGMYDSLQITQDISTGRVSALRVSPVVMQTGYTGTVRGLLIDPVLTGTSDFRAIETLVNDGAGFQLYAGGSAPSYFKGRVGINTDKPQSELAVNGTITAVRVKVTTQGWADYVFDSAYQLPALPEVEKFIQQNKHLPDVPSAATVSQEGIDVGDNQVLLLKKIEELTLYIIEQNKKLEARSKKLEQQGVEIELLKQKVK